MNETDARVVRTREQLRSAFIKLVIEQGYDAITVLDIADQAKVGRKTFYRHYQDKEALLYATLEEIIIEGRPFLLPPESPKAAEENTLHALRFAHRYAELLRVLLRSPVAEQLLQPLFVFGITEGHRFFGGSTTPDALVAYHFVSTMMALTRWWIEQGMPYPPEEMAEYINRLLIRPISQLERKGQSDSESVRQ